MSSSKGSSSSTFTPPPEVVEAYKEALGYGRAAMGQQYQPYTGEITAPLTPTQESGIYNVNRAVGTAIPYFGQATAMTANAANTPITPQQFSQEAIQQYMSPYTKSVADATFANLREQQRQEQEALQGQAIRAGAFGGDRAGIAAANMARQQDLATAQAMSQIYNQGYGQAVGLFGQQQGVNYGADVANAARQMQGAQQLAGLGTGLQGSVLQGAQAQLAAGAQQQAVQQAINSGYYNQYLGAQAYPYQQAQFFANLATGVGGQMGGTTTGQQAQPSPAGSIFGALGALGSIFAASDKRVKENIKPIGKTNDGQTIYRYNFKGDPTTQIGLIAQEVEKKHPEAVRSFNGVKAVDYKEATDDSVRSMGGGVVPSSTRKDFATGGPSLSDEEDPMIPYKAGVPSKVLQIPKLAKIGGSKPNFGGEPPKSPSGPSKEDFKGAAEGLGKAWNKFNTPTAAEAGQKIIDLSPDFEKTLSGLSFDFARGGAAPSFRPRFADGEDVPVTEDTAPIQVASLGDVTRTPIADREPARAPEREPEPARVGLVPTMARRESDLPPLFSGEGEGAKGAPEPEAKPASVPSMARADTNVPAVKPGLEPAKAPAATESNPILEMIRVEAERQGVPFEIAKQVAGIESKFAPGAKAKTSSAGGIYQIIDETMRDLGGDPARKYDPEYNIKHGIKYIARNYNALTSPDDPDAPAKVYMGHFFGTNGAKGILRNPDAPISQTYSDYRRAVASNPGVEFKGKPIAEWTGRDAQEWAAAKMAGTYEPRQGGAQTAGLGAAKPVEEKRTQIAAAGENWPGFGVAGEGKRSIVESLMGKDLDPIQKRAMFAFFAGMAASPSPWFGQQLGAGMQAASNVYNDSMNKQAEIGIKKEQLGLEEQKIGVSERLAEVQEKTKAIEALKFWQSRFKQIPTAEGFAYLDTTTGQTISQDEYNRQMGQVTRQLKLTPTDTGGVAPKPGLAPSAPAGAAPTGGLAPQPKPEVKATPEVDGGASAETAPVTIPKPTEVPKTTAETKPAEAPAKAVEAAKPKADAESAIYQNVRDDYNPIILREKADEQRKIANNAQKLGDLASAKAANDLADSYSKKAVEITENKVPVVFKDGTVGRIPQIEEEARRAELEPEYRKKNLEANMEWRKEAGNQLSAMQGQLSSLRGLKNVLENFSPDILAKPKSEVAQYFKSLGVTVPDSAMENADSFYKFIKLKTDEIYKRLQQLPGRILVTEVAGMTAASPSETATPESARYLVAKMQAAADLQYKYIKDVIDEAPTGAKLGQFDREKWIKDWESKPENRLENLEKYYDNEVAARGATPNESRNLKVGKTYILEPGQHGNTYDRPAKFRYVLKPDPETGKKRGYMEPVVGNQ